MTGVMKIHKTYSTLLCLLLLPHIACAQVVVTEIMYDPPGSDSGHEWIELFNGGSTTIPLSSYKIRTGNSSHRIARVSGESTVTPGTYAVIAQNGATFLSDFPNIGVPVFHSSISLNNTTASIELLDASGTLVSSVTYDSATGAEGDGNSLQRGASDEDFIPRAPSPGTSISTNAIPLKVSQGMVSKKSSAKSKSVVNTASNSSTAKNAVKKRTYTNNSPSLADTSSDAGNTAVVTSLTGQTAAVAGSNIPEVYWWAGLAALVMLVIAVVMAHNRAKKTEWDIIEETPEDV